jgi:hypothetical protein
MMGLDRCDGDGLDRAVRTMSLAQAQGTLMKARRSRVVWNWLVIGALVASSSGTASAGPSDKVLQDYRKAAGGKALQRVRSTLLQGTAQSADGTAGTFTLRLLPPDRMRLDLEAGATKVTECYNGKSAWRLDGTVLRTLLGVEAKRLRLESLLINEDFHDLKKHRILALAPVAAELDGKAVQSVDFVMDDARTTFLFDVASHQLAGQRTARGDTLREVAFGDFKEVDGVLEPHSLQFREDPAPLVVTVDKVVHNSGVAATDFDYPRLEGEAPLPEVKPLLESIVANQGKLDELREQYTFLLTQTESEQAKDGTFHDKSTKVYEVTPTAGDAVRRLISKDGKPLSPDEQAKEDKRVDKEAEKLYKERDERRKKKEEGKKDEDDLGVADFLRLSRITSLRRETFRGQPVIAFDFEPPIGLNPKNRVERLIIRLAGTMWIDETARQVARLEARLTKSFKIGGGIVASLAESSAFVFEQEKVRGELWLPSYAEAVVAGKFLLFASFKARVVQQYSDYKKYEVESTLEVGSQNAAPTPVPGGATEVTPAPATGTGSPEATATSIPTSGAGPSTQPPEPTPTP